MIALLTTNIVVWLTIAALVVAPQKRLRPLAAIVLVISLTAVGLSIFGLTQEWSW